LDGQAAFTLQARNQTIYFTPQGITFALTAPASRQSDYRFAFADPIIMAASTTLVT
jgi:hypothetical protein